MTRITSTILAKELRFRREQVALTQQQVAKAIQVPPAVVNSLEHGGCDCISFGVVMAAAHALDLELELRARDPIAVTAPTYIRELEIGTPTVERLAELGIHEIVSIGTANGLLAPLGSQGGEVLYDLACALSTAGISMPPSSGHLANERSLEMLRLRVVIGLPLAAIAKNQQITRESVRQILKRDFGLDRRISPAHYTPASTNRNDPVQQQRIATLTARERQIFEHLVKGRANKRIAYELKLSVRTIENYSARISRKLNVSRGELVGLQIPKDSIAPRGLIH